MRAIGRAALATLILTSCGEPTNVALLDASRADAPPEVDAAERHRVDAGEDDRITADAGRDARQPPSGLDAGNVDGSRPDAAERPVRDASADGVGSVDSHICDATQPPSSEACVISEEYGVFVAPTASGGNDVAGTGTRAAPYATITNALSHLGTLTRVYVCDGIYVDQVTLTSGVGIYGGLTCDGGRWAYAPGTTATIVASAPGFALQVSAGSAPVDIEDMTWDAVPGIWSSPSSVAAWVVSSSAVTLRRNTLTAAAAAPGANGLSGSPGSLMTEVQRSGLPPSVAALDGEPGTAGGESIICTCTNGETSVGGAGGNSSSLGAESGTNGAPAQSAPSPPTATGAGSTLDQCYSVFLGGANGSDAVPSVAPDGPGASSVGAFDAAGWHPARGTSGTSGSPGQGGGGGAFLAKPPPFNQAGGGGACGGCGGMGGNPGGGGGGSIALLAYESPVSLFATTLASGTGGAGGVGGVGGAGQAGGTGGLSDPPGTTGCAGGNGGTGATGGAGGGGAGGVSFAILYQGAAPIPDGLTTLTAGAAGPGGGGGGGGPVGIGGVAAEIQNAASF